MSLVVSEGLESKALAACSKCTKDEIVNACEVKRIHDFIEEAAYKALADAVVSCGIRSDSISECQSGAILAEVKRQAHLEMYRKDGYICERAKLLTPSQVRLVIKNVGKIVHERDTKLTDGRYNSLTELILALDDHNMMVKDLLLRSWFQVDTSLDAERQHLEEIKGRVDFYSTIQKNLNFDLQTALTEKQEFWDRYFPGLREPEKSCEFVNILEVRQYFGGDEWVKFSENKYTKKKYFEYCTDLSGYQAYEVTSLDEKISEIVFNDDELPYIFEERFITNTVRRKCQVVNSLIDNPNITLGEFLEKYFPECL